MWYKNGNTFIGEQAVRFDSKASLPQNVTDTDIESLGYVKVVDIKPQYNIATEKLVANNIVLINGVPTQTYSVESKTIDEMAMFQQDIIQHFTDVTTAYIEGKVQEYNKANGLAFKDIDAFTKYAVNPLSVHNAIANQFIAYADTIWHTVRTYQATATTVPTDAEFKALLDSVVF